jgi:hypothetical protein
MNLIHGMFADISLTPITTAVSSLVDALTTGAGTVITSAIGLAALYFGGRWLWRVFKSFTR